MHDSHSPMEPGEAAHRQLAGGGFSGAQLDRMWSRLNGELAHQKAPRRRPLLAMLFGLATAAAIGMAILIIPPGPTMTVRGGEAPVVLVPDCGQSKPCSVGQRVHLKIIAEKAGYLTLFLMEAGRSHRLGDSTAVAAVEPTYWPGALVPEPSDVPELVVAGVWTDRPVSVDSLEDLRQGSDPFVLHVAVAP